MGTSIIYYDIKFHFTSSIHILFLLRRTEWLISGTPYLNGAEQWLGVT